ncbi:MAG TPA: tRNA guanosine(34) transglycosylase Tgt [Acidobacteriaceae bacterium]|jgi:queuine tRNA-ribosyltransferase|nr:tRNA guanosine(34) transglycosylase Tgt [Acidobacteriaceae bacterium]
MSLRFDIHQTAGSGRRATMTLPHGAVETPVFMPVGTQGTVKAIPQHLLEELDVRILLGNTYHLYLRPGHEAIRRMGGLHRFMSWPRAILTDSGGFQVFSLSDLRKVTEDGVAFRSHIDGSSHFFSPEHSMDVQIALGSDIAMAFDECTEYPADRTRARASLDMTLRWARRSQDHFEKHKHHVPWRQGSGIGDQGLEDDGEASSLRPSDASDRERNRGFGTSGEARCVDGESSLFGIVQGGMFPDLRRECAERLVEMEFPGYAIGGLSVGEPRELTREIIATTLPLLPKDKPRYVMGVGYPDEIAEYARMGVDMMDCVLPTRAARHGLLFTSEGRLNIRNRRFAEDQGPADPACTCLVCRRYTRAYLRHLFAAQEPLAAVLNTLHNLAFYLDTMRRVRDEIAANRL